MNNSRWLVMGSSLVSQYEGDSAAAQGLGLICLELHSVDASIGRLATHKLGRIHVRDTTLHRSIIVGSRLSRR